MYQTDLDRFDRNNMNRRDSPITVEFFPFIIYLSCVLSTCTIGILFVNFYSQFVLTNQTLRGVVSPHGNVSYLPIKCAVPRRR